MAEPPKIEIVPVLDWFYRTYGSHWTLALLFTIPAAIFLWQLISVFRKDREANMALMAKEDTIQRLAHENRMYRIQVFKDKFGWSDVQIEAWIINNEPASTAIVKQKKKKKKND